MILFESVSKQYRGTKRPALDGVSLNIDRGEFVFIVGASGSGKSSCLRLILREEQPSGGRIHVLGHDLGKISNRKVPYFRRNLGVVFQDFRLLVNKTVYDNVAFSLQVIGKSRGFIQEAVPDVLEMVGLSGKGKRFPHELSGGEQQRVAIARAIVNKPAILLADEPTGNLDPATSLGIMNLLRAINAAGTTVVMATHEATFVDVMQQRVIELSQGVIVRDEQRGGYGETASIPVSDLSAAGLRALRTSEEVVRQTLSAAVVPVAVQGDDRSAASDLADLSTVDSVSAAAGAGDDSAPDAVAVGDPAGDDAAPDDVAADDVARVHAEQATKEGSAGEREVPVDAEHSVHQVVAEAGGEGRSEDPATTDPVPGDELDDTLQASRAAESVDPRTAEPGSIAAALGLREDPNTDVGPVR